MGLAYRWELFSKSATVQNIRVSHAKIPKSFQGRAFPISMFAWTQRKYFPPIIISWCGSIKIAEPCAVGWAKCRNVCFASRIWYSESSYPLFQHHSKGIPRSMGQWKWRKGNFNLFECNDVILCKWRYSDSIKFKSEINQTWKWIGWTCRVTI